MRSSPTEHDLIIAVSPCGVLAPAPRIVNAARRGGGLGVLDLGRGDRQSLQALAQAASWAADGPAASVGIRVDAGCGASLADVEHAGADRIDVVVLTADAPWSVADVSSRYRVLVEVTNRQEAREAASAGAYGLITRGMEAGGRVGELSSFVLLQQLLGDESLDLPIWVAGGIGERTAVACVIGGAAGVVLDTQLALMPESELPGEVRALVRRMDGSETVLVGEYRGVRRSGPGLPADAPAVSRDDLLPIGQDGYLADAFAKRWPDTAAAVRGLRAAILAAVQDDAAGRALLPGASLAEKLGVRVPVAQGPMTRVSDQAAFAAAVAADGAMPFLALALSNEEQSRRMLRETAATVADRPWGVGVLGFAPDELRAVQIEAIRETKPSCVIIAGGRPAQAKSLEQDGIPAFLHVPSPGLLRQFLRSGARRFVFEGAECGGHVGPRASFPLWEAQLAVLDEYLADQPAEAADEIQVLFAGGVHDSRSAAMVAAMAAPLSARGAHVGVLMGTAYLFTREAVEHGAIQPLFHQQALAAQGTSLLETAPGHATRCLDSQIVDDFQGMRAEMEANGTPGREIWEKLEMFNVGRLRIASKGLRRDGDALVDVDETTQAAEGLFMAGQVAVLRDSTTTVAALHGEVSTGAHDFYEQRATALRAALQPAADQRPEAEPLDIAVIGMSCVFPGANDLAEYWQEILAGRDAITEVPADRWDVDNYYSPEIGPGEAGRRSVSKWGGFLSPIVIDPIRFGIPPTALSSIDPTQLLALEVAHRALVDAGYAYDAPGVDHGRTGVVFGAESGTEITTNSAVRTMLPSYIGEVPAELDEQLPTVTEDSFPGLLPNVIAGRIANRLDLGGSNFTVDAACASSLAAVDVACKELITGASDMMLCGGADLHNGVNDFLMFTSVHALSPTGRCRTFDSTADGIALGEGAACVVLKRLSDAQRDGDRVYAVIKGVGAASDGRALGLTAPRPEGQRRALDRAYGGSGVSPRQVGLIEAHGTGTVVGDRTEMETLTTMFADDGAQPASCVLGSVKSQIGHTKCAAGLAGMIKASMAVYTGVRPPTINLTAPNPAWHPERSPFAFLTAPQPWLVPAAERAAGVSAFGFGGTNFHVVLTGHAGTPEPRHAADEWPAELFCFRGNDRAAAHRSVRDLLGKLEANDKRKRPYRVRDFAAAVSAESDARPGAAVQVAVVARDLDELADLLHRALAGEHEPARGLIQPAAPARAEDAGKVAFLFPGQGSQRPGALGELFVAFPELRHYLDLGKRWADKLFPPAAFDPDIQQEQEARVRDTTVAQPVLGIGGLAADHLLRRLGVRPDLAGGHSYGELVALCTAGAFDPETLLSMSHDRASSIMASVGDDPGSMAAVKGTAEATRAALAKAGLADQVVLANHNSPTQLVISGPTEAVTAAIAALKEAGLTARRIPVACAFHSPVVAGAGERFAETLAGHQIRVPDLPVYGNRTAAPYPVDAESVRGELAEQVISPVRWVEQVEAMYEAGARIFVEVGPGEVLTKLVRAVLDDRPHLSVACDGRPGQGLRAFLTTVAQLACAGVPVRTDWLFHGRATADITAATDSRPRWTVDGQLVRDLGGATLPGGLTPARPVKELSMTSSMTPGTSTAADRDRMVSDFLRTSREIITAQRDVLLAYLGGGAGGQLVWQPAASTAPSTLPFDGSLVPAAPVSPAPAGRSTVAAPPAPAPAAAPAAPAPAALDFEGAVLAVLSELTGYPVDLIELDLDLEADLSVDSIKRAEVAGEVAARLQLPTDGDESELEGLVKARTVRAMVAWLNEKVAAAAPAAAAPAAAPSSAPAAPANLDFEGAVLAVLSELTGYPVDLIELDLDLEADLSVDSIKRAEVAGEVAARLQLPTDGDESELEGLVKARTVRAMVAWLNEKVAAAAPAAPPVAAAAPAAAAPEPASEKAGIPPKRLVARSAQLADATPEPTSKLDGATFLITGDTPVADRVAKLLGSYGATVRTGLAGDADGSADGIDGLIVLDGMTAGTPLLPGAFPLVKQALAGELRWLLAAGAPEGGAGTDGLPGLFRTIAREFPETSVRFVTIHDGVGDADNGVPVDQVAQHLVDELLIAGDTPVVSHRGDHRFADDLVAEGLGTLADTGAGPAGEGVSEAQALGLDSDSVVVLVGGARGITARFALTLASASRCRIELVGRTALPDGPEDPALAAAVDATQIRKVLVGQGMRAPAEIEQATKRILAGREVTATLAELRALGSPARYHQLDVRDGEAATKLIKEIHGEYGRLDGVVYAAGVIEDKRLADKSPESFTRVFETKVCGARTIFDALDGAGCQPRFVVLFGSIAAAYGNPGQCDYAAANDAMDSIGARWSARTGGRCVTVHWGPWAPSTDHRGMVTAELSREYAKRGIEMIDPEEGALSLLRELAWGDPAVTSVVSTASGW